MPEPQQSTEQGWPVFEVWTKYEDIAMHFNDLLIRLRTQALGAIAALGTNTHEAEPTKRSEQSYD
jgi:hypothetical protein